MTEYKVSIETVAESDLRGILKYISDTLKEPKTATRVYNSIKEKIVTMNFMSHRYPLVNDEVYASRGLRKMPAENYFVFFVIDESRNEVIVLRVLYSRREWQNLI